MDKWAVKEILKKHYDGIIEDLDEFIDTNEVDLNINLDFKNTNIEITDDI